MQLAYIIRALFLVNKGSLAWIFYVVKVIVASPRVSSKCNRNTPGVEIKCSGQHIREAVFGKLYTRKGPRHTGKGKVTGGYLITVGYSTDRYLTLWQVTSYWVFSF